VSAFAEHWLELREPYDHAARSGALASRFAARLGGSAQVIDLACGTGSNLRYLSPRLGSRQTWLCFDFDPALLAAGARLIARWADARGLDHESPGERLHLRGKRAAIDVALIRRDLGDARRGVSLEGASAITASAFLDLVSAAWLDALIHRIVQRRLPCLFALTYDGRLEWWPRAAEDEKLCARFNAHQQSDRGFGAALGPEAAPYLARRLEERGYRVEASCADWRLDAADRPLIEAFLDGFASALGESGGPLPGWLTLRRRQLEAGELRLTVGHQDVLALPQASA
jgi:SAM-dependent methyltransferase